MNRTKNQLDRRMKEKSKKGGNQQECKVIQRRADQWCRDNGYPIQRSKYWQKRKWTPKNYEKI